ncbi:hypothetical protein LVJ94_34685 [Pendulispora rubella]|uniref:Uncharacterized protein n=1 Tax=Pendulispora rubella TaxID=2741070 RepID=A0ABZ2KTP7_9BACT
MPQRIEEEFWLTESGTLKLITRLRTPQADAVVDEMIRVYRQAISELRAPEPPAPARLLSEVAHGPRVGDSAIQRREVAFYCRAAANACSASIQSIHGFVRREFRVPGIYHLSVLLWPQAKALLEALGMGRLMLPKRRPRLLPAHPNQQRLWS